MPTTASRPVFDSTDSLTPPARIYSTWSQASPCVKIVSPRPYFETDLFPRDRESSGVRDEMGLVVEDDREERVIDFESVRIVDESEPLKFFHEEIDT